MSIISNSSTTSHCLSINCHLTFNTKFVIFLSLKFLREQSYFMAEGVWRFNWDRGLECAACFQFVQSVNQKELNLYIRY